MNNEGTSAGDGIAIGAEPQTVEPQTAEPQAAEPQATEPQTVESQAVEPQAVEPRTGEPQVAEAQDGAAVEPTGPLAELESLIADLKNQVGALREGEYDAAALEQRLRDLNELAIRAANVLDAAAR